MCREMLDMKPWRLLLHQKHPALQAVAGIWLFHAVSMFAVIASHLPSSDFVWRHFSFGRARCFRCFWHSTSSVQFDERLISEA